jgi:insertion element IS1 protein InsB
MYSMIAETITYRCQRCESTDLIKNGHSSRGKQQYICKSCGRRGVVNPEARHSEAENQCLL